MDKRLENKVCLVTGGASGIGECIVRKLSEEGGIVYIGDLSEERGTSLEKQVQNSKYVKLDVTSLDKQLMEVM